MKRIILPLAILALSPLAAAHPHDDTPALKPAEKKYIWPYFGKKPADEQSAEHADEDATF